jgi:hypothetical protein
MLFDNVVRNWANKERPLFNDSLTKGYLKDQPWVLPRMGGLGRVVEGGAAGLLGMSLGSQLGESIGGDAGGMAGALVGGAVGALGPSRLMGAVNWRNLAVRAGIKGVQGGAAAAKFAATGTVSGGGMLANFLNWEVGRKVVPDTSLSGIVDEPLKGVLGSSAKARASDIPHFATKTKVIPGWHPGRKMLGGLGGFAAGAAIGGAIGGEPGAAFGAVAGGALGMAPGYWGRKLGQAGVKSGSSLMKLAAKRPGLVGVGIGALMALPAVFSAAKNGLMPEDVPPDAAIASSQEQYGMSANNLDTQGLTLALWSRRLRH